MSDESPSPAPVAEAPRAPKPRSAGLWIGACYSAHLGHETLGAAELFDHLVITEPPRQSDPYFPPLRERIVMPLQDGENQLADPIDERATEALRQLAVICNAPWIAERVQCMRTLDGKYSLDAVFPPLYTEEMRERFATNALKLGAALARPLVFENVPSPFTPPGGAMSEGKFLGRLLQTSRGSLQLNLTHLWVSAELRKLDPYGLLHEYPLDRVSVITTGGIADDPDLSGPWMSAVAPSEEMMEFTQYAVDCCRGVRAVTFDATGPALDARLLVGAVSQLRERLAR